MEAKALLLLFIVQGTVGGPLNFLYSDDANSIWRQNEECATRCTGSNKFQYDVGKTYVYSYEVATVTSMHGASNDVSRIDVKATANIHVLSKCELALTLSDVTFSRSVPEDSGMKDVNNWAFKSTLESNTLYFSFQDGSVEDLCPSDGEETMSLNFKRGVLSAFQNSMSQHERDESIREVDITGTCPTDYTVAQKGWKSSHITKVKDLLGCVDRNDYMTSLQATAFRVPDAIQSLPLLKGNYKCTQKVSSEGFLQSSTCVESLVFRPFSKKEAGARTETTQKMTYTYTQPRSNVRKGATSTKTTLLFEHKKGIAGSDQNMWSAQQKLTSLCQMTVQDIPAEVPGLFTDLVYLMRGLETSQLEDIEEKLNRGAICVDNKEKVKKFYLDALPMVGTSAAIEMMVDMLTSGEVTGTEADVWISSLHFIQHPTIEMIPQLKRLLVSEELRMSALLPVTSMVNNFCRGQSDCLYNIEVGDIVDVLDDILGSNCQSADQDLILMTLRAVGNLGYSDALASTLIKCAEVSYNPMGTRVTAVQAFRGTTCAAPRDELLNILSNKGEDSELRIAAYLSVMQCWDERVIKKVWQVLDAEPVNQVGSFIWTHITNLAESDSPHKQEWKGILNDEKLKKEYDMDKRKYSRNYEVSYFSDRFGTGGTADANLIFSSKSFVPRSASVNLTADVFGHSFNLLEIGGRVQGAETVLRNYFGSQGIFKGGVKQPAGGPTLCTKPQKMDDMKNKHTVSEDELSASIYLRMFGNELGFHHFNEKELTSFADKFSVKDILATLAKGRDISYTQSALFIDSSITVPTVAGMALTLSVNGTSSVELVANGKMDLRKFSLKKMEAVFDVRPSGAVKLSGMMSLDAGIARAGLKMVTTLHTSTSVSGSLDLTNGQLLNIDLDTPKRNMDLINVKSEFFLVFNEEEKKQNMLEDQRVSKVSCTSKKALTVLGYELCGAVSFVNASDNDMVPYFPFTGSMDASITLHKKDAPKGFKFEGKFIQNAATAIGQLSFDTPGSTVDRAIRVGYFVDVQAKSLEAELTSPWKTLMAKGQYKSEPQSRALSGTVMVDGSEYKLVMKMDKDDKKGMTVWTPTVELVRPKNCKLFEALKVKVEKVQVGGTVQVDDQFTEMAADISITTNLDNDPIVIKGNFINKERQHTIAGSVTMNKKDVYAATLQLLNRISGNKLRSGKLEPTILITTPKWRPFLLSGTVFFREEKMMKGDLQMNLDDTLKEAVTLDFKVTKQNKKGIDRYRVQSKFASEFADIKTKGFWNVPTDPSNSKGPLLTSKLNIDYNLPLVKTKALRKNKVLLSSKIHDRSSKALMKYDVNLNLDSKNFPDANLIANLELSHKDAFTKSALTVRHGPKAKYTKDKLRELSVEMSVNHKIDEDDADIRYGLKVLYPQQDIEYEIKGKHEHHLKKKFSFETYTAFVFAKGKTVEVRLIGEDNTKKGNLDASGDLELSFPAFEINGKKYDRRSYKIGTTVQKNIDKEYIHTINLQVNDDVKHSLVTKFKMTPIAQFDLYSQLQVNGDYPAKVTFSLARASEKVQGSFELIMDDETYRAESDFRFIRDTYPKYSLDLVWPERRVKSSIEGGKKEDGEVGIQFQTMWDADKDPEMKIEGDFHFSNEENPRVKKYDMLLMVTTPFEGHKKYSYSRLIELTPREMTDNQGLTWGTSDMELSYSMWILLPPSLERFEMKLKYITPLPILKLASLDIVHKFDGSKYLSSSVKGAYNDDSMAVALLIANKGDTVRNNLESSVTISSTLPKYRNIILKLEHRDDGRVYSTVGQYERNGKQYKATFDATYFRIHYQVQLDSKLDIEIPLDRPITLKLEHTNTLTNLNSSISLSWKTEYDTKLVVGGKLNKAEKDYAIDLDYSGPWQKFKDLELQVRFNDMSIITGSAFVRINKDPRMSSRSSFRYTDSELFIESFNHVNQGTLRAHYGRFPYTVVGEVEFQDDSKNNWDQKKMILEASVDEIHHQGWSATAKLVTPWKDYRNIDTRGSIKKNSKSEWEFESLISLDVRKQLSANFIADTENWANLNGQITTPYREMTLLSFGYTRDKKENVYSTESYLEIQPIFNRVKLEETVALEPEFMTHVRLDLPDTEFKYVDISIDSAEHRRGYTTDVKVAYHPEKEIDLKFKGRYNKNKFPDNTKVTLDLSTPYDVLPSLNVKCDIDKQDNKWQGEFDLKSAAKELEYMNVKVAQTGTDSSCYSDFEIASSVFETVAAGMHFDWGEMAGANLTLTAPSVGRSMIGFKKKSKSWTDFQNKVFAEFSGNELDMDVGLKHDEDITKAWLLYSYPGADHSYIQTSIHREGSSAQDFDVGGFLQVGKNSRPYNVSMQYSMVPEKYAIGTTLDTPYTKALSYLLKREQKGDREFVTVTYGKYGRKYLIDQYQSYKLTDNRFDYTDRHHYIFNDNDVKYGNTFSAQWSDETQEGKFQSYYADKWVKGEFTRKLDSGKGKSGTENIDVMVFTPFKDFTDIGLHAVSNRRDDGYDGSCSLEYMDEKEAVLTYDLKTPNQNRADLDATLILPVEQYRKNTLTYKHISRKDQFSADAEVITGKGEHLNGKFEFKNQREYELTLQGPVEDFEFLKVSGKYDENEQRINGDASLKLSLNPQSANLEYDIHINNKPATLSFKLRSPYENVRKADLTIQHEGQDWKQFRTTAELNSEKLGKVISDTTWRFSSVTDMEGKSTFTSSIDKMENLKLGFSTTDRDDKQVSRLEVGWHIDKEITVNNEWSLQENAKKTKFSTSLDVATPFQEFQMVSLQMTHTHGPEMFTESITLYHNSKAYLDGDISYEYGNRHEGTVEIRNPRPMHFFVTGTVDDGSFDGLVKFNWDKRSPEAHIELQSNFADRSINQNIDKEFKFKAIHPVRTMGIDVMYKKANSEILSSGLVTWDEQHGNTFSYDIGWLNRTSVYSQMYEGHVKLGVPQRSVKFQGSYSDTGSTVTTTSAVLWDADKDDKKKVTMTTTVETRDNFKRVGLNINLPNINKQLNLGATTKGGYRSTLLESQADISYSSDPRKNIVVTSVIKNTEFGSNKNYNYTMDLSFEHPVTDTNIQISSHLGSVDKICSVGGQLEFLTARREKKVLAFLGKVDRAKQNVEVKVVTPLKTIGVEGQVEDRGDRQHIFIKSFEDNKQALKLDMTVDSRRRNMDIEFNYDQDDPSKMVKLSGHLVNDSAVQVDLTSQQGRDITSESMVAVTLNRNRILHSRILWRPTLFDETQTFVGTKITAFSYAANEAFSSAVDSVGTEVKAKYVLVSQELRSEMSQVFQLMEKEMDSLSVQLETLRTEFRRFYQRNDLHIKDMGDQVKAAFDELFDKIRDLVKNYRSYYTGITKATNDWLSDLKNYPIANKYAALISDLVSGLKELREVLEETLNDVAIELEKFSEASYKFYLTNSRIIDRKLNSYTRSLQELPKYRQMVEEQSKLKEMGGKDMPEWFTVYDTMYFKGQEILQNQFHDLMSRPEFQHMHAVAHEFHQQILYWHLEDTFNMAVRHVIELSKNLVLMELSKLKDTFLDLKNSRLIVYDPEKGVLEFEIHLPIPMKSLVEGPEVKLDKYLTELQKMVQINLPSTNASVWDLYYDHVPSLEPSSWVPPFEASAYLIGSQHYFTFDGTHYDFLSTCSHVLARDMVHDNFSVVVNYERRARRDGVNSICFNFEGDLNLEVSADYRLEVNSKQTEMPFITDKVRVVREGDIIRVEYTGGLQVLCNPNLDLYKFTVSGWHHGKLAGLLGEYNNEQFDDESIEKMSNEFEVNRRSCNSKNIALQPDPNTDLENLCYKAFEPSSSKFRPCFSQVDRFNFIHVCQIYMSKMPAEDAVYMATEQYRSMCRDKGVYMGPLEEYMPCNSEDPFMVEGNDPIYQSADVVFVVEDSSCNQWAASSLALIVTEINNALTNAGMKDNRFGLESYGGVYANDVSVRTMNGQQFGEASLFLKALETLRFSKTSGPANMAEAMRVAMNYPYRPGIAKVLVIAPCSSCEVSFLERSFGQQLQAKGFTVHVLQDQNYEYPDSSNRGYKIYGVDNSDVFTNYISDDTAIKTNEVQGKRLTDYCVSLAQSTNGSVFDTTHLNDKNRGSKDFIKSFAQHVGWDTKLPSCQNCKCSSESGRVECEVCISKSFLSYIPWKRSSFAEALGSLHDFNHEVKTYFGYAK